MLVLAIAGAGFAASSSPGMIGGVSALPLPDHPTVLAEIRAFIANWFRDGRDDGLDVDTPLVTSGIVDSAGIVEVVEFLERRFGVRLTDADINLENCNTLRGLCELVRRRG